MKLRPNTIRDSAKVILGILATPGHTPGGRGDLAVMTHAEIVAGAVNDVYAQLDEIGKCVSAHLAGKPGQLDGIKDAMQKLGYDFS